MKPKPGLLHAFTCLLICMGMIFGPVKSHSQGVKTFIVNNVGDASDPNAGNIGDDGRCDTDPFTPGDQCSLRAAIQNQNGNRNVGQNTIVFNIPNAPGTGSIIIHVGSTGLGPLPSVLGSVLVQGINSSDHRRIEVDGSMAGGGAIGLQLLGETCNISFLIINNFSSHGIFIGGTPPPGGGAHVLQSMYIGTDETGTIARPNGGDGIQIFNTPGNMIGGAGLLGNIIAGNGGYGIRITGPDQTQPQFGAGQGNKLVGNNIGQNLSGQSFLPNKLGGILNENEPNNNIGGSNPNEGNKIVGTENGIKLTGNLTKGLNIDGNFIGKDGTGGKFHAGILARCGEQLSIKGNFLENIDSVGMDLFLNASGGYDIRKNEVKGDMKVGAKFTFGPGQVIDITYQNNLHDGNGTGLHIDESANGTINWLIVGDTAQKGQTGANVTFRTSGKKEFDNNLWNLNSGVGFKYTTEILPGVTAKFTVNGDAYTGNGQEGFSGKATVNAQADFTYAMFDLISKNNGKDGWALGIGASAGATGNVTFGGKSDLSFNAGAAIRLIGDAKTIDAFKVTIDHVNARGNRDPNVTVYLFDFVIKHSVTNCAIADNTGAGIVLDGLTQARVDSNTITNNGAGILIMGQAIGDIGNNTITGNGKGVILAGTGTGTTLTGNSISGNTSLGIDLGNDGVTPNIPGGATNFPVLSSATSSGGNTTITGTLNTIPGIVSRLEFFSNDACHPSGFGEGKTFLGFAQITTDVAGNASFSASLPGITLPNGSVVTATATNGPNNTSEFSACLQAGGGGGGPALADLQVIKTVDSSQISVGKKITYTITVLNKGPEKATGVIVTDSLPSGLVFSQATATVGSYNNTTRQWMIGTLNAADKAILTLVAVTTTPGSVINSASITASDQQDPDKTNNTSSISVTVTDTIHALSIQDQIKQLSSRLRDLVATHQLSRRQAALLNGLLQIALRQYQRGNKDVAVLALRIFIAATDAFVNSRLLNKAAGHELIATAQNIIAQIEATLRQPKNKPLAASGQKGLMDGEAKGIWLYPNYPNPFSTSTTISFELPKDSKVSLMIVDQSGRIIIPLLNEVMAAGVHSISWQPQGLAAGVYYVRLRVGDVVKTGNMVYVR